jgi:hypothetical protein
LGQIHFSFFPFYFHELGPTRSWATLSPLIPIINVDRWICPEINSLNDK